MPRVCTLVLFCIARFMITFVIDQLAMMAIRCLAILFGPIKTKKLEENVPYILKIVPVSICKIVLLINPWCTYARVTVVCLCVCVCVSVLLKISLCA